MVDDLKLPYTVPYNLLAENLEMADLSIFTDNTDFILGGTEITQISLALSFLSLGIAFRCLAIL